MHRDHYSQAIHLRGSSAPRVALGAEERWSLELVSRPGRRAAEEQVALLRALGAADIAEEMHRGSRASPRSGGVGAAGRLVHARTR